MKNIREHLYMERPPRSIISFPDKIPATLFQQSDKPRLFMLSHAGWFSHSHSSRDTLISSVLLVAANVQVRRSLRGEVKTHVYQGHQQRTRV